jgi:hypothetical protein
MMVNMWIRRGKKISPIFIPARRGCGSGLDYWQGPVPSRKIRRCEPTVGKVRGPCPGHDRWLNTVGIRKVVLPIRRPTRCGSAIVGWHGRSIILCWILVRKREKRNRQNKRLYTLNWHQSMGDGRLQLLRHPSLFYTQTLSAFRRVTIFFFSV